MIADHKVNRDTIRVGVVDRHRRVLRTYGAVQQRHDRFAFDLRIAVRHRDRRLFVATGQKFRSLVSTIINDGLMETLETRSRIRRDVLEVERLQNIHHEVRTGILDDAFDFNATRSSGISSQLGRVRHNRRRTCRRRRWSLLGLRRWSRNQSGCTCGSSLEKTTTIDGTFIGFHQLVSYCPLFSLMICCKSGMSFVSGGLLNVLM